MGSGQQSDRENYRLIVFSEDRSNVMIVSGRTGFALPAVEIPRWQRSAENLTAALEHQYGCTAISLFAPEILNPDHSDQGHYQAMECACNGEKHLGAAWTKLTTLTPNSFQDGTDFQALQCCIEQFVSSDGAAKKPFAQRGWFTQLRRWAAEAIAPLGLQLSDLVQGSGST